MKLAFQDTTQASGCSSGFSSKEGLWTWSSELFQKGPNCMWPGPVWCPVLAMIVCAQLLKVLHKHNHISGWREAQLVSKIQVTKTNAIPMLSLLIFLSQSIDNTEFYGHHSWELLWARVSSSSAKHAASWQSIPDKILHFWKFKAPNWAKVRGFHAAWCLQSWYMQPVELHTGRTSKLIYSAAPAKERVQPRESFSLSLQVNQTANSIRKSKTGREMLIHSTVRHSYWEGKMGRQITGRKNHQTQLVQKQHNELWSSKSSCRLSIVSNDRDSERWDRLAAEQQKTREIMMIIRLHFFYTDQQSTAIQAVTLGSPGDSVASIATGGKSKIKLCSFPTSL